MPAASLASPGPVHCICFSSTGSRPSCYEIATVRNQRCKAVSQVFILVFLIIYLVLGPPWLILPIYRNHIDAKSCIMLTPTLSRMTMRTMRQRRPTLISVCSAPAGWVTVTNYYLTIWDYNIWFRFSFYLMFELSLSCNSPKQGSYFLHWRVEWEKLQRFIKILFWFPLYEGFPSAKIILIRAISSCCW